MAPTASPSSTAASQSGAPKAVGSNKANPPRHARFDAAERGTIVTKAMLSRGTGGPILDARARGRFDGSVADPRPGVAPGHIPGARNLPFGDLYREDGTLKPDEALAAEFAAAGIDPRSGFIATCGSGVTATSLFFAARRLGGVTHDSTMEAGPNMAPTRRRPRRLARPRG